MRVRIKRHERIKMRLRLAGTSLAQIARDLGVRSTTVASVSRGTSHSRRIEATIARALGTGPEKLWPDRYPDPPSPAANGAAFSDTEAPMT